MQDTRVGAKTQCRIILLRKKKEKKTKKINKRLTTCDHLGGIINLPKSIIHIRSAVRQVRREPRIGIVQSRRDDPEEEGEADKDVQGRPVRAEQRVAVVGDHGPVERQREQAHARDHAEDLVDGDVVGHDPADPGEVAQPGEDEPGEPVPDEGGARDDEEEADARDAPAVGDGVGARVQRAQQGDVAQHAGPDHARGLDEPPGAEAGDAVAQELAAQHHHDAEAGAQREAVVARGLDDVGRVGRAEAEGDVAHDGDEGVLLDVEVPVGVEAADGQQLGEEDAQGEGDQLGDERDDVHAGIAEGEELVDTSAQEDEYLLSLVSRVAATSDHC